MKKKYIITDVDGVLLDRMPVYGEIFSELLCKRFNIDREFSKKIYFSTSGTPIGEQFALVIRESGFVNITSIIAKLEKDFFAENAKKEALFFPGAKEVISKLTMDGCALFASSGSQTEELKNIFIKNNLHYSVVMGSDVVKKSSKHIEAFAKSVSAPFDEFVVNAIYIGDGPGDMKIAKECNIQAVGILTCPGIKEADLRNAGADYVIHNISEFPKYVL